jgi:hypothetical protein
MSRTLSTTTIAAITAQQTNQVLLLALEIDHADLADPIRIVNNNENVTYDGETYSAFPFELNLPIDSDDRPASMSFTISNIDRSIVELIRSIDTKATVIVRVLLYGSPCTLESELPEFNMSQVTYDENVVTCEFVLESFTQERFPAGGFYPSAFPGMFS